MSASPRLVAQGTDPDGRPVRVVAVGTRRIVEIASKDALGQPRWTQIGDVDLAQRQIGSVPGNLAAAVIHVLDDIAAGRDAVAETMIHKPKNYREG